MKKLITIILILAVASVGVILGCAKDEKEIKIGAILVLTGSDAKAGQSAKQGLDLATEEINSAGGINGQKLRILYEDDAGDPQKAVSAVLKLIDIDKVPAIVGPMWSSPMLAAAPIAERKGVVILSPTASNPKITEAGDFVFRNTYSDAFEGSKTADYAYERLGYTTMGVLYINNDFGVGLNQVFSERFSGLGGRIAVAEAYDPKSTDFRSQLVKFKHNEIEAVYLIGYSEVGQVLKQARELGIKCHFVSTIMFEITDVARTAGEAAEGVVYAYVSYDPQMGDSLVNEFAERFKRNYGTFPDPEAAFSYDALKILASVMSSVGLDPADIKEGLYEVADYHGVTGKTTFDENGDVLKPIGFKRVEKGEYVWESFRF